MLTSRYTARVLRLLRDRPARFEVISHAGAYGRGHARHHGAWASVGEGTRTKPNTSPAPCRRSPTVSPIYVRAHRRRTDRDARARRRRRRDERAGRAHGPRGPACAKQCGFCYELRLHRARGYGALEGHPRNSRGRGRARRSPRSLSACSARRDRPRTTCRGWKTSISVTARQKRYSFTDPLLRRLGPRSTAAPPRRPKTISRARFTATRCRACRRQSPYPRIAMVTAGTGASAVAEDEKHRGG